MGVCLYYKIQAGFCNASFWNEMESEHGGARCVLGWMIAVGETGAGDQEGGSAAVFLLMFLSRGQRTAGGGYWGYSLYLPVQLHLVMALAVLGVLSPVSL